MSELSVILDEAEVARLIAERGTLQVQMDAVAARIDEIDRALAAQPSPEVTHLCPQDGAGGVMSCCRLTPFDVPRSDRMTLDPALVTCGKG